jgi:hypothetical protein
MKKNSVGLLELETAVLECFLEKTPLSPLGVNNKFKIITYYVVDNKLSWFGGPTMTELLTTNLLLGLNGSMLVLHCVYTFNKNDVKKEYF